VGGRDDDGMNEGGITVQVATCSRHYCIVSLSEKGIHF
jgi:hypothetical protein